MTDDKRTDKRTKATARASAQEDERARDEAAERRLGRTAAFAIPALTVAASIGMGVMTSAGPAILVLAGGALVGTITLFWASLRTLGGDAPLPEDLEVVAARGSRAEDLAARKASILRALRDLEHERSIGKIDDDDYRELATYYREQAKAAMREMDAEVAPLRGRAEEIAATYLKKRGVERAKAAARAEEEADDDREDDEVRVEEASEAKKATKKKRVAKRTDAAAKVRVADVEDDALDEGAPEHDEEEDEEEEHDTGDAEDDDVVEAASPPRRAKVAPVEKAAKAATSADRDAKTARSVAAGRTCPSCSTSNDEDAAFCKKCATRLDVAPAATEASDAVS